MWICIWHPKRLDPNANQRVDSHFIARVNFRPNFEEVINRVKRHVIYKSCKKLIYRSNKSKINHIWTYKLKVMIENKRYV